MDLSDYWPKSLAHLAQAYDNGASDHVVIAEIDNAPHNGFKGERRVSTALVPLADVDRVLQAEGGIGCEVESWGPSPIVASDQIFDSKFWISGSGDSEERFDTIVNSWKRHDREVLLPDNVMLMAYGLVPRFLHDGVVCWDDPGGPVYDVLQVKSHVSYNDKKDPPVGRIVMRRDYLEDYCSLKACAAVAVFYEERYSADDASLQEMLQGHSGVEFKLPGRILSLKTFKGRARSSAPQFAQAWGCRLILRPSGRPISVKSKPALIWPGDTQAMTPDRAARERLYGYVSDEVLCDYEARPEFDIHSASGGVGYGGWWSVGRVDRIGRNHIRIELKGLYERCPAEVISHWHRFTVKQELAERDHENNGNLNIAVRTKVLIEAFLNLTHSLELLSDELGAGFSQSDIGALSREAVEYHGWWTTSVFKPLGCVAKVSSTRPEFLSRAVLLFQVLECLKPAPLRNLCLTLGIPKDEIKDFRSLKLLACLCQLASVAKAEGYYLPEDAMSAARLWNNDIKIEELRSTFALNTLRDSASHTPGVQLDLRISNACAAFSIDPAMMMSGWGVAIDRLYDQLASDIETLSQLIRGVLR